MDENEANQKSGLPWALLLTAAALAIAVYASSLGGEFINWDDPGYVQANANLERPAGDFIVWAFTTFDSSNWHPLTWLTYKVEYSIWGLNAHCYRATNLVLHVLNTLLAGMLFWRLFRLRTDEQGAAMAAALAALVFAVHPLHVESVAWISERKDVLYASFWLMSLMAYVSYAEGGGRRAYLASLGLFALSIMSKPMAITLSAVIVVLDFYPLMRKPTLRTLVVEKLPFFALSAFSAYMTVSAHVLHETVISDNELQYIKRSWVALRAIVMYIADFFYPVGLSPFYPLPKTVDWATPEYLVPAGILAAIMAASIVLIKRAPVVAASIAIFLITLSPTLNIIQVGEQSRADRYMYLPMLCLLAIVAAGAVRLWQSHCCRRAMTVALAVLALALSGLAMAQSSVWKSDKAFWSYLGRMNPGDPATQFNIGKWAYRSGSYEDAARMFRESMKGQPYFPSTYHYLAASLYELGRYGEAVEALNNGLRLDGYLPQTKNPNFTPFSRLYLLRGISHEKLGRLTEAEADYRSSIQRGPREPKSRYNLINLLNNTARYNEADVAATEALKLFPKFGEFYRLRADARLALGDQEAAANDYLMAQSLGVPGPQTSGAR